MNPNLRIINPEPFQKAMIDFCNGKRFAVQIAAKDYFIPPVKTKPLPDYKPNNDFPHCCENHKALYRDTIEFFEKFPDCCEYHSKLKSAHWFNKDDYAGLPMRIMNSLAYTQHCIVKNAKARNWEKIITDYIELTFYSYGQLPDGYGSPVGLNIFMATLIGFIEVTDELDLVQKKKLIDYVNNWGKSTGEVEAPDLNLLINTYRNWLDIFPFYLPFFKDLKDHFEKQMPLISEHVGTNIFSKWTSVKIKTYPELVSYLVETTGKLLSEINAQTLYANGVIKDFQKSQVDYLHASHAFNQKRIISARIYGRHEYVRIIKEWFGNEKQYLRELSELVKPKEITTKRNEPSAATIAMFCLAVNEAGIIVRKPYESVLTYCKNVCKSYDLKYTDVVRQKFSERLSRQYIEKIRKCILPRIDAKTSKAINEYFNTKAK